MRRRSSGGSMSRNGDAVAEAMFQERVVCDWRNGEGALCC